MRLLCSLVAAALVCAPRPAANEPMWPGLHMPNQLTYYAMHWALVGAAKWLKHPECKMVFSDFTDQGGVRLDHKLAGLSVDEVTYLQSILFRDGSRFGPCSRPQTLMFTTPGSKLVYVCEKQLLTAAKADRAYLNAMVIHELLHTLGLGENPPTTRQISERVLNRCRR